MPLFLGLYDFWLAKVDYEKNAVYYYVRDGLGSVTALVDDEGKVRKRYFYSPFGKIYHLPKLPFKRIKAKEIENSLTYTGREYDRTTRLYYYRARYYDPSLGRFITVDPLIREFARSYASLSSYPGGSSGCLTCGGLGRGSVPSSPVAPSVPIKWLHPYVYVKNNPVNFVDPEGLRISPLEFYELSASIGWKMKKMRGVGKNPADWARYVTGYTATTVGVLKGAQWALLQIGVNQTISSILTLLKVPWWAQKTLELIVTEIVKRVGKEDIEVGSLQENVFYENKARGVPGGYHWWMIVWPRCGGRGNLMATWESASGIGEGPHKIKKYSINQKVKFYLRGEGNPLEVKELKETILLYVEYE